ncbi:MAG: UDP-N-acetylmuramoyl-L-alanine--D-glutamate ligase [Dialister sp.]|nr:UDP-N-acetylmuramoyl-L-alanine--D-glutamate ligase [Dialister sp.]
MNKALIMGAGVSGLGAAHVLLRHGWQVAITDLKDTIRGRMEKTGLEQLGAVFYFGPQNESLLENVTLLVISPVIPRENPVVSAALKRGISVISEVELAYRVTKAPIAAITGTNGKTTTTALLAAMIECSGKPFALAGNLGISLSREAELVPENGIIAAEVSSFQVEFIERFHPRVAAILNITPDHLERHHTMEAYAAAKARIFENMDMQDDLLLNAEDSYTPLFMKKAQSHTRVSFFSTAREVESGAFLRNGYLVVRTGGQETTLCKTTDLQLKGDQNYQNALAASFMAIKCGIARESIIQALKQFHPLANRIESVRTLHGVSYYNDSKATNTDAAIKGMQSFDRPVILIAGGYDKGIPLDLFMNAAKKHARHLILLGAAAERFKKAALEAGISSIQMVGSMHDAVLSAQKAAHEGDIVLLSPACSSFDMYNDMEERGMDFKKEVNHLS